MTISIAALAGRKRRWLGGAWAWRLVLGFFVFEALWFVFSAQYPMAFDENYHFGLIQLHAQQWLPFFTSQPDNTSAYGAIVRDPSYLYHWLMSFPYRLTTLFTHNQTVEIIVLRLLNVAMFAYGLTLYRRVLARMGVSRALSTGLFAVFVLVPVVPFLAATINYDNMLFVAVAATALLALKLVDGFGARRVPAGTLLSLVALLFISSLIKYPYLPVFVVTVVFVVIKLFRAGLASRAGWGSFVRSFAASSRLKQVALVLAVLVSMGLFVERYGENIVVYHNPVPACNAVISEDACEQYGPYGRDVNYTASKPASFHPSVIAYVWQWLYGMWYRLFFAINYNYATAPPLLIICALAIVLAALSLLGITLRFRALFVGHPARQYTLWLCVVYIAALFADGYSSYAKTGQPVAINGRYLIPFLPFLFAFGGLAWSQLLHAHQTIKVSVAALVIALFVLQGGGTMTFIIRSGDDWMWQNSAVRATNRVVRSAAWPFIIGKGVY